MISEKKIEQKLVKAINTSGGVALKFVSPGNDGVPDRLVLMPEGKIAFVEVKAPGNEMRALQKRQAERLKELGFKVFLLDSEENIGVIIDEILSL